MCGFPLGRPTGDCRPVNGGETQGRAPIRRFSGMFRPPPASVPCKHTHAENGGRRAMPGWPKPTFTFLKTLTGLMSSEMWLKRSFFFGKQSPVCSAVQTHSGKDPTWGWLDIPSNLEISCLRRDTCKMSHTATPPPR